MSDPQETVVPLLQGAHRTGAYALKIQTAEQLVSLGRPAIEAPLRHWTQILSGELKSPERSTHDFTDGTTLAERSIIELKRLSASAEDKPVLPLDRRLIHFYGERVMYCSYDQWHHATLRGMHNNHMRLAYGDTTQVVSLFSPLVLTVEELEYLVADVHSAFVSRWVRASGTPTHHQRAYNAIMALAASR